MGSPGETDLQVMLASLGVERRPGVFTMVELTDPEDTIRTRAHATVREDQANSLVLAVDDALAAQLPVASKFAWLTLTVESSLDAVGLTAAISATLADAGISCNMLAGYRHDHLLVPVDRVDEAIAVLTRR